MNKTIEEYTQDFLMYYRKNLSDAGMSSYSTQKMLIDILVKTIKDFTKQSYKPSLFKAFKR